MRIAAALSLLGAAMLVHAFSARTFASPNEGEERLYVSSPAAVERMALGFDALAADVYWIRALQHYGRNRLLAREGRASYDLLYPLLDMTTTLDPYFNIAYRFGAIFLSEPYPGGPGRPDLAIELLRKGIEARPGRWQYYHDAGFVEYSAHRDARAASAWFRRAASLPDAPNWLLPVAAALLGNEDRAASRQLWLQILQSEEPWLRERAVRGLQQLDALDENDRLRGHGRQ